MNSPQLQNREPMLKESIKHFLISYQNGSSNFTSFETIFFRLIQTMLDPPLEITWFYSAVTFHAAKLSPLNRNNNPSTRVLIAKDLLSFLISSSNLSSVLKKVALFAPVVYELYNVLCDCRGDSDDVCVRMEVESLVEKMIGYVMVSGGGCDNGNGIVDGGDSVACFEDLVRVWMVDRGGGSCEFGENLRAFFLILGDGIVKGIEGSCGVGELAGVVLCELFFLRLLLKFRSGTCREELLKDIRNWTVQSIKGFRNLCFLDILLKMLLEPSLPITFLLSSEDSRHLQQVLYDAVVLVDYSSLYSGQLMQSADGHLRNLAFVWSLVAETAIQFARASYDEGRAISYVSAFCESQLVNHYVKWVYVQAGIDQNCWSTNLSTPKDLIKWLLVLEDQGIKVFDHDMSRSYAKAVSEIKFPEHKPEEDHPVQGLLGFSENESRGDHEMGELSKNGFHNCMTNSGGRKRKEGSCDLQESAVKHVKHGHDESPIRGRFSHFTFDSASCCGNRVKNIVSDDDMEVVG